MSVKDTLAGMADIADRLEYEGAEILSAGVDKIAGPRLHLWDESLPDVVRERGAPLDAPKVGYTDAGITVFWVEAGA